MFNLQQQTIKEKLAHIGFDQMALDSGFDSNYSKKIDAFAFLFGFLRMYSRGAHSLSQWAASVGWASGQPVSKQAIDQRLSSRSRACFQAVVEQLLAQPDQAGSLWRDFPHLFIEDSTCWPLPSSLAKVFPGSYSPNGPVATARLQVCYDARHHRFHRFSLQSFRDNDQKHAPAITHYVGAGDLVIRDLGYFSQHVFSDLAQQEAFFVSRLHYRVGLFDQQGVPLKLGAMLRRRSQIDLPVMLGSTAKLPVRLIGFKLPQAQANQRRRRAKKDTRTTPSQAYLQYLGWSFFVTNLPASYTGKQISDLYRLRWRIEMIFKGLKSGLPWKTMFVGSYERIVLTLHLMLIYVILCWRCFAWFYRRNPRISMLKFLAWYHHHFDAIMQAATLEALEPFVTKICRYEQRTRPNYAHLIERTGGYQNLLP